MQLAGAVGGMKWRGVGWRRGGFRHSRLRSAGRGECSATIPGRNSQKRVPRDYSWTEFAEESAPRLFVDGILIDEVSRGS